ncbi:MAG: GTPase Era, partial [Spirochaetota bacterium]|nr:GTPase Era [Spirochaetota bacterium]
MKSSFITLIGRPSAGKSTLMNELCGHKISIVAPSPQTTRNKVRGILTEKRGQLVFIDTPGYHLSDKKLNLQLQTVSVSSLDDADLILYVIDSSRRAGEEENNLSELLGKYHAKLIIAINKIDLFENDTDKLYGSLKEKFPEAAIIPVSALKSEGIEDLKASLFNNSPEGEKMYPDDFFTDQDPEFRAAEIIREKAINRVKEELPHAIYIEISDMEEAEDGRVLWIRAFIIVERESQKGIVVGKGGAGIKAIRVAAQKELNGIFPYRVMLDLRVKASA